MQKTYEVEQIALSKVEFRALKEVARQGCVSDEVMGVYPYDYLLRLSLLEHGYSDQYPYVTPQSEVEIPRNVLTVSDPGRLFLAYRDGLKSSRKIEWIRYLVTTGIAVAALLVAIASLLMQTAGQ